MFFSGEVIKSIQELILNTCDLKKSTEISHWFPLLIALDLRDILVNIFFKTYVVGTH